VNFQTMKPTRPNNATPPATPRPIYVPSLGPELVESESAVELAVADVEVELELEAPGTWTVTVVS